MKAPCKHCGSPWTSGYGLLNYYDCGRSRVKGGVDQRTLPCYARSAAQWKRTAERLAEAVGGDGCPKDRGWTCLHLGGVPGCEAEGEAQTAWNERCWLEWAEGDEG